MGVIAMTLTKKQYSNIRAAVRNEMFKCRDSYLWYLEHEHGGPMTEYYYQRYEQYAALRDLLAQADEIELNIK